MNYSVLMAVYFKDEAKYLELAIDSMLNQTVKPEQFVIVIDGSVSESLGKIIEKYENMNPALFTIVKLKTNEGLANALNIGLQVCRNELVARMDADDISLPERCEKELKRFGEKKDLVICGCNIGEFCDIPQNIKQFRLVPSQYKEIVKFMRWRQPFNHPTVIFKKSKIIEVGMYPKLKRKEDFDLFSRILTNGFYAENLDDVLYLYRANDANYERRKSWLNVKSALEVYTLHFQRGGCYLIDYIIICFAEIFFFIIPPRVMQYISDRLLRKNSLNKRY